MGTEPQVALLGKVAEFVLELFPAEELLGSLR